jgi:hypothetical protein
LRCVAAVARQARMLRSPKLQCESGRTARGSSRPRLRAPASGGIPRNLQLDETQCSSAAVGTGPPWTLLTATKADRQLLAPRRHTAPAYFLRRPRPRARPATTEPGSRAFGTRLAGSKVRGRSFFVTSLMKESTHSRCVAVSVEYRSTSTYSTSPTTRRDRISVCTRRTLFPTTVPPPRPSPPPPAMRGSTPYLLRQRRYPAVGRSPCSFTHCPTSRPSDRRFANRLHGSLTSSR